MTKHSQKRSNFRSILDGLVATILLLSLAALPCEPASAGPLVKFVKPDGVGLGSCDTWAHACTLQYALSLADPSYELWVMEGTYYPTDGANRSLTFTLKNNVGIYGGFVGVESTRDARNWRTNLTTLSGNIQNMLNLADNSYHVVTASGTNSTAVLDGFRISYGYANVDSGNNLLGGGMYNIGGSPTLTNLTFSHNHADLGGGMYNVAGHPNMDNITFLSNTARDGGGMYNFNAYPVMDYVKFQSNSADSAGGGLYNDYCISEAYNINLAHATFIGNSALSGGGLRNSNCSPHIQEAAFINNTVTGAGGGMENLNSSPTLQNVTFSGNTAGSMGGGMDNSATPSHTCDPILNNVTFHGNSSSAANAMSNDSSNPTITNSIIWENTAPEDTLFIFNNSTPVITYSDIEGGFGAPEDHNINADPLLGDLGTYGSNMQVLPLLPGSPAIDAGQDSSCAPIDERDITRPMLHHCDMGAYESHGVNLGAISGGGQSTPLLTAFPDPLIISVTGYDEEPVNGGRVYLNLPSSGASATPASPTVPIAGGQASMTFTANGIVGSYYIGFYTYGSDDLVSAHYMTNIANPDVVFIFLPLVVR